MSDDRRKLLDQARLRFEIMKKEVSPPCRQCGCSGWDHEVEVGEALIWRCKSCGKQCDFLQDDAPKLQWRTCDKCKGKGAIEHRSFLSAFGVPRGPEPMAGLRQCDECGGAGVLKGRDDD